MHPTWTAWAPTASSWATEHGVLMTKNVSPSSPFSISRRNGTVHETAVVWQNKIWINCVRFCVEVQMANEVKLASTVTCRDAAINARVSNMHTAVCRRRVWAWKTLFCRPHRLPWTTAKLLVLFICGTFLYHTMDLYQPWKIAIGRADITLATGWYSVNDGPLQTAAHASATDVCDWLLQAARHCLADM